MYVFHILCITKFLLYMVCAYVYVKLQKAHRHWEQSKGRLAVDAPFGWRVRSAATAMYRLSEDFASS